MKDSRPVIDAAEAAELIGSGKLVVVDCRFSLQDAAAGRKAYLEGHVPTAVYAHLEEDLSGPPTTDAGRHPLPEPWSLANLFGRLGIAREAPVLAYDDASGLAASRLWWLLRFMDHEQVMVLDGGLPAWIAAGYELVGGEERNQPTLFEGAPRWDRLVAMREVARVPLLVDSRAPERFRGEVEPIDPLAGHIPGAVNLFHGDSFGPDGRILPADTLRERFETILGDVPPSESVYYCGSGVTACNNLLAMVHAGLGEGRLYNGSWSEWCRVPTNPVEFGETED